MTQTSTSWIGARISTAVLGLAVFLALSSCREVSSTRTLRLAHGLDVTHPVHRSMRILARRAQELSNGSLRIEIYPSEQLGSEREALELLQIGSLAMTKVSASVLESFAPAFEVFGIPYLFDDREHLFRVLEGTVGKELLLEPQRYRLRGLCYYDAGSRSFYTRSTPIRSPEDLAGLKIRTQESPSAMRMVRALGGSPTPIAWGELYSALQQGVVDGAENNPPSFHLSRHYEVARTYALDEHTTVPDVLLIATEVWRSLTPDQQAILEVAVRESAEAQKKLWKEAEEEALRVVEEAGVEIYRPSKSPFQARVAELREEYRSKPELRPWIDRVLELSSTGRGAALETSSP